MRLVLELIALAIATLTVLMSGAGLTAAPAPLIARAKVIAPIRFPCGAYTMAWQGTDYATRFDQGGHYQARNGSTLWSGSWRMDGITLVIRESTDGTHWLIHRVRMEPDLYTGTIGTVIDFRLGAARPTD